MTMNPGGSGNAPIMAEIAFRHIGTNDPRDTPGGGPDPSNLNQSADARAKGRREEKQNKSNADNSDKQTNILTKHLRSTLGINLGIASILKQSQIFTGTLGTIFQILGAMVDVVLAAFMPIIIPALKLMAKNIPGIQKAAENMVGLLIKGFNWIRERLEWMKGNTFFQMIGRALKTALHYVIVGLLIARLVGLHGILGNLLKLVVQTLIGGIAKLFGMLFNINRNTAVTAARSGGGMHPGGGMYNTGGGGGRGGGRGGWWNRMGVGRLGMGAGAVGLAGLGLTAAVAYGHGGFGSSGLGGSLGGMAVGGAIGGILGGPAGAMLGANIGAVAGPIIGGYLQQGAEKAASWTNDNFNNLAQRSSAGRDYDTFRHDNSPDWLKAHDASVAARASGKQIGYGPV